MRRLCVSFGGSVEDGVRWRERRERGRGRKVIEFWKVMPLKLFIELNYARNRLKAYLATFIPDALASFTLFTFLPTLTQLYSKNANCTFCNLSIPREIKRAIYEHAFQGLVG